MIVLQFFLRNIQFMIVLQFLIHFDMSISPCNHRDAARMDHSRCVCDLLIALDVDDGYEEYIGVSCNWGVYHRLQYWRFHCHRKRFYVSLTSMCKTRLEIVKIELPGVTLPIPKPSNFGFR